MFKKLTGFLVGIILLFGAQAFGISYSFTNYPAKIYSGDINSHIKNGFNYLRYFGNTTFYGNKVDIKPFKNYVKTLGQFRFMRFGYYWNDVLGRINNNEIDLDYLDNKRLKYPIGGIYVGDYLVMFIHKNALDNEDREKIGNYYSDDDLVFIKKGNWYITKVYSYIRTNSFSYNTDRYLDILETLYNNYNIASFQIGQNPFDIYEIELYGDDILQLEVELGDKLKGIIISLKQIYGLNPVKNEDIYGQKYIKDQQLMRKLTNLYDNIENYYESMGSLPQDIGSLNPSFYDISALNNYHHKIKYENINYACYKIGFKPKSSGFKRLFNFEINNSGYRFSKYCLK